MNFGFLLDIGEITPSIFSKTSRQKKAEIFINLYNACVDCELKIPLKYAKSDMKISQIFDMRIDELCKFDTQGLRKISVFCTASNLIIKAYKQGGIQAVPSLVNQPKHKAAKLINLIHSQNGICFDADVMFSQFVYDKIRRKHFDKSVYFQDGIIFVELGGKNIFGVMPCFKEITKERFHLVSCEISKGFSLLNAMQLDKMFIVAPRNENFLRYIEVKNGYEYVKSLRLVPYTISHHIF